MQVPHSPQHYLFNLHTTSPGEAKRLWRRKIKDQWDNKCAYCGCEKDLTIDHIVPRSKGGPDFTKNCLCACHSCNQDKAHTPMEEWYSSQEFFSMQRYNKIKDWTEPETQKNLYAYRQRRNNAS